MAFKPGPGPTTGATVPSGESAAAELAAIVESSDDAIIGKDLRGIVTSWNAGAEKIFGYAASEMIGQSISPLIAPERLVEEENILGQIGRGESARHFETVRLRKDGTSIAVSVTVSPIRDSEGKIVGASKVARDITNEKRMEESLRENEEFFAKAFWLSPDCVALERASDRTLIKANDAVCRLWGTTPEEVIGKTTEDFSSWLSEEERSDYMRTLAEKGECLNHEATLRMNDGRLVQFSISSRMITLNGESCILSVRHDITEERLTEKALIASELRYRRLFETAQDGILILNAETGMVDDVNPFLMTLLGFSREQFLGKAIWDLGFFKDVVANEDKFAELREKEYVRYEHLPLETSDGRRIGAEFVSNVYLVNGSKVIQCNVRDVTARRKAEEAVRELNAELEQRVIQRTAELEAANRELEAFSYSVSHDLRAPLRAVDGFSQAVLEDYGAQLPEEGQRYLQTIREGAQKMGALIDDLLTFSRLSRAPLNRKEVDTGKLVRSVLADLSTQQAGRQIDLRIGELPACSGDPALLKQVWINLLSNAFKYTQKRLAAVVEVGCEVKADRNVFFVRDNGTGFDMRYAGKLFGVFQRLHRAEDYEGTGVGLAIVQRVIHRHGGRIWADAAVDRGATFYFTLEGETKP